MLPIVAVQKVLFDVLTPALAPVPVRDNASADRSFPYVSIGECTAISEHEPLNDEVVDIDATVHVWSRQPGMQETGALMETAKNALHAKRFDVAGFQWVICMWQYGQTMRDADGITRHGVLRFKVQTFLANA